MTTIVIAHPNGKNQRAWQVFGSYNGPDDRYIFALKEFAPADGAKAEAYARRLMARGRADHFERIAG